MTKSNSIQLAYFNEMVEVCLLYAHVSLKPKFQQGQQEHPPKLLKILQKYVIVGTDQEKEYEQKVTACMEIPPPVRSVQLSYPPPTTCSLLGAGGFAALFAQ